MNNNAIVFSTIILLVIATAACDPPQTEGGDKTSQQQAAEVDEDGPAGIDDGGITSVSDDPGLIEEGEGLFASQGCVGCHAMDRDSAGPSLGGVTERRSTPWLAKMIMNPHEMVAQDPQAAAMSENFPAPMLENNLTPEQTKAIIAYLGAQ